MDLAYRRRKTRGNALPWPPLLFKALRFYEDFISLKFVQERSWGKSRSCCCTMYALRLPFILDTGANKHLVCLSTSASLILKIVFLYILPLHMPNRFSSFHERLELWEKDVLNSSAGESTAWLNYHKFLESYLSVSLTLYKNNLSRIPMSTEKDCIYASCELNNWIILMWIDSSVHRTFRLITCDFSSFALHI